MGGFHLNKTDYTMYKNALILSQLCSDENNLSYEVWPE